jgi:hypothetical protein
MKVNALKAYLREHGLPLSGAKYALVARCAAHARGDLLDGPQRTPPPAHLVPQNDVEASGWSDDRVRAQTVGRLALLLYRTAHPDVD